MRSALLSPLTSRLVMMCQVGPGLGKVAWLVTAVPFHSQICGVPLLAPALNASFWNTRSEMTSPLKSNGGVPWKLIVVVAGVLRLFEPLPSLRVQLTVRVRFDPKLVG